MEKKAEDTAKVVLAWWAFSKSLKASALIYRARVSYRNKLLIQRVWMRCIIPAEVSDEGEMCASAFKL